MRRFGAAGDGRGALRPPAAARGRGRLRRHPRDPRGRRRALRAGVGVPVARARRRRHRGRRGVRRRAAAHRRQPRAARGGPAPQHRRPRAGARRHPVDERGYIVVDDQCRTSAEGVWAVGDCNGRGAFTHTSWNDHEIVVANLFDADPRRIARPHPLLRALHRPGARAHRHVRRPGARQRPPGAAREDADEARGPGARDGRDPGLHEGGGRRRRPRKLLGAAILGVNGDEVVHALLDVMAAGLPYTAISRTMHIHPTVSELVPTLLQQLQPLQ